MSLYNILEDEINKLLPISRRMGDILKKVKGVSVFQIGGGLRIELDWGRNGLSIIDLFEKLDEWIEEEDEIPYLVVAFDEAQLLRFLTGGKGKIDFREFFAYIYDNLKNIRLVLTGSEMGLLLDFLGFNESGKPLYGRYREEIILKTL